MGALGADCGNRSEAGRKIQWAGRTPVNRGGTWSGGGWSWSGAESGRCRDHKSIRFPRRSPVRLWNIEQIKEIVHHCCCSRCMLAGTPAAGGISRLLTANTFLYTCCAGRWWDENRHHHQLPALASSCHLHFQDSLKSFLRTYTINNMEEQNGNNKNIEQERTTVTCNTSIESVRLSKTSLVYSRFMTMLAKWPSWTIERRLS